MEERRHGEITYLAFALSLHNTLQNAAKRCPEGTPIHDISFGSLIHLNDLHHRNAIPSWQPLCMYRNKVCWFFKPWWQCKVGVPGAAMSDSCLQQKFNVSDHDFTRFRVIPTCMLIFLQILKIHFIMVKYWKFWFFIGIEARYVCCGKHTYVGFHGGHYPPPPRE